MQKTDQSLSKLRHLEPGLMAIKLYWPVILLIQACALLFVLVYYYLPTTHTFFEFLSTAKSNGGLLFASITTVFSGGIIPESLKAFFRPKESIGPKASELMHQFTMWALLGILIDFFYKFQTILFGDTSSLLTVFKKAIFDQLVFTPLVALPFITSWFLLFEVNYKLKPWLAKLHLNTLVDRILPLWAIALSFWPIMLLVIYSLPALLQFPLFLFGNAAFSILMIFIIRRQGS